MVVKPTTGIFDDDHWYQWSILKSDDIKNKHTITLNSKTGREVVKVIGRPGVA